MSEERGIEPPMGRLLAVDRAPSAGEGDRVLYLFDGGRLEAEAVSRITLQADKLLSFEFLDRRALRRRTIPRSARRIEAAMGARNDAATIYLEHGEVPHRSASRRG